MKKIKYILPIALLAASVGLASCNIITGGDNSNGGETESVFSISYECNGGDVLPGAVNVDKLPSKLPVPERQGYTFAGWYTDSALTKEAIAGSAIKANTTLYAKWEVKKQDVEKFTITFNSDGGSIVLPQEVEADKTVIKPADPTKSGYVFEGWYNGSTKYTFTEKVTADVTLTAHWKATYSVSFDLKGHGNAIDPLTNVTTIPDTLPTPTCSGYTFLGWYKDSALTQGAVAGAQITSNTTLYAKWVENIVGKYSVIYNTNGGNAIDAVVNVTTLPTTLPTPTKTGHTFAGWYKESSFTTPAVAGASITENTTLYAKWNANKYTVTFNSDGGSSVSSQNVDYNTSAVKPADPTKSGYTFAGWYNGSTAYTFTEKVTGALTLTAHWTEIPAAAEKITITYVYNNGSANSTVEIEKNSTPTRPANPTKSGYTFEGWYKDSALTNEYEFNQALSTNTTLYARFDEIETEESFISSFGGYNEGMFATFAEKTPANSTVEYKLVSSSSWEEVDSELIRADSSTETRVDVVGLTPGTYDLRITNSSNVVNLKTGIVVSAYDRSGYAHFNNTGVGAYNDNGTLKSGADVIYVTEATKNTVTWTYGGKTYTGISAILQNQNKSNKPMVIRIIGTIGAATWKHIEEVNYNTMASEAAELLKKAKSSSSPDGTTINDAEKSEIVSKSSEIAKTLKGLNGDFIPFPNSDVLTAGEYKEDQIVSKGWNELDTTKYSKLNGLTNKIKWDSSKFEFDSYYNMLDASGCKNVTVEGIGTNATLDAWGFTFKSMTSVEVRNLTFNNAPEDCCSFEGEGSDNDLTTVSAFKSKYIWLHNNTFNLGYNSWDVCSEQDKHDGDGSADFKRVANVTVSYNHYINTHKTGLVGGSDTQKDANFTFHHNFYDTCKSRLPFARQANMHMYNNYYYKSYGTNMQLYAGAYAFIENCYFDHAKNPMEVKTSDGKVAAAKLYNNTFDGCSGTNGGTTVTSRTETVTNGNLYGQTFDTDSALFYYDSTNKKSNVTIMHATADVPTVVPQLAGVLKANPTNTGGSTEGGSTGGNTGGETGGESGGSTGGSDTQSLMRMTADVSAGGTVLDTGLYKIVALTGTNYTSTVTASATATANDGSGYIFTNGLLPGGSSGGYTLTAKKSGTIKIYYTISDKGYSTTENYSKAGNLTVNGTEVGSTGDKSNAVAYMYQLTLVAGQTYELKASSNRLILFGIE